MMLRVGVFLYYSDVVMLSGCCGGSSGVLGEGIQVGRLSSGLVGSWVLNG